MTFDFLVPFYKWLNTTSVSEYLQGTTYAFPVAQVFHIIAFTMFIGAVVGVCLRLLGFGMRRPVAELYEGVAKWSWCSLGAVVVTGILQGIAEPIKLSTNPAFGIKEALLPIFFLLYCFGYLGIVKPGKAEANPMMVKLVGFSLMLCLTLILVAGRSVGFV